MKIGDRVEVVAVPESLPSGMGTQELFEACVGRIFPIRGIDENGLLELHAGEVVGEKATCIPFGSKLTAFVSGDRPNETSSRARIDATVMAAPLPGRYWLDGTKPAGD